MMKKKVVGVALACALAMGAWSGAALATPITVDGVTFDPASPLNLTVDAGNFRESPVSKVGDVLNGYGQIAYINGSNNFCIGCNLTFTFHYTLLAVDAQGTASNPKIVFDSGMINFYVSNPGTYNVLNPSSASMGSLFLTLSGHTAAYTGFSTLGQLYSTINGSISKPGSQSSGFGLLDVTGGDAGMYFDTNTQADGSDFALTSSFQNKPLKHCPASGPACAFPISGTGELIGDAMAVPEPGPAGLLGVGLGLMGLLLRRRRKEAEQNV